MEQEIQDVIIVGAGIAGLACANAIIDKTSTIKLRIISPQLCGKLTKSNNNLLNYGPYYIREDYHHLSQYFIKTSHVTRRDFMLHDGNKQYKFDFKYLKYIFDHLAFKKELKKFNTEFQNLRKECLRKPQSLAIQENPYLHALYQMKGSTFIENNFNKKYFDKYISYILKATSFDLPENMNAFHLLALLSSLNVYCYRYVFKRNDLLDKINCYHIPYKVQNIKKIDSEHYQISTENNLCLEAKHVVLAASTSINKTLLNLSVNQSNSVYEFHISGDCKKEYSKYRTHVFDHNNELLVMDRAENKKNEFLLYAKTPNPNFEKIFNHFSVIKKNEYPHSFHLNGSRLLEFEPEKNLLIIGDHNIPFMEDVFIYGTYAGNVIYENYIRSTSKQ